MGCPGVTSAACFAAPPTPAPPTGPRPRREIRNYAGEVFRHQGITLRLGAK